MLINGWIVIIFLLCSMKIFAMQGINEIKSAISAAKNKKVYLIIGVRCGEEQFNERFGHLINSSNILPIFADYSAPIKELPGQCLTGNFNDLNEIKTLAEEFPETFDVIITDGVGTTKFLGSYDDAFMRNLNKAIKHEGHIYYHDSIDIQIDDRGHLASNVLLFSQEEISVLSKSLPQKLGSGFKKLPMLYFPSVMLNEIIVDEQKVVELTEKVSEIIAKFQPSAFISTANTLFKLGLKNAGLMSGRKFTITDKDEIKKLIYRALQKNSFDENLLPGFIEEIKGIMQNSMRKSLSQDFYSIDVVSLDHDQESLNIITPKDRNEINYIVYKLKKYKSIIDDQK